MGVRKRPGEQAVPPPFPQPGAGGAAPAGGTGGVPLYPKRWRVGRWDSGVRQARPFAEGGRAPQQDHPSRESPRHPPIAKYERLCYSSPMKSATGPLLFLGACRIHEHWGLTTEHPPVAGALREQPKGQDPPRKAGAGANAVVGHRLLGAAFRLPAVSLRLATAPSQICPGSVTAPFEGRLVNVAKCRQLSHSRDICPLECYGLPLSLPPLLPLAPLPAHACSTPGRPLLFRALPEGRPPRRTRTARRLQRGGGGLPGRDGYPDGEAAPGGVAGWWAIPALAFSRDPAMKQLALVSLHTPLNASW